MRGCVALLALAACGRHEPEPPVATSPPTPAPAESGWTCEQLPFAASTPVPEASGAAWLTFRGKSALFVLSDSGNTGAYAIVDPDSGETVAQGQLPKGDYGDDFEGVAARAGKLYAVLSGGYYVVLTPDGDSFTAGPAQPLGDRIADSDEPRGHGTSPPRGKGMRCADAFHGNCGRNFEGICLDDTASAGRGPCAGFVASKADGHLYCLVEHDGAFTADYDRSIAVTGPNKLADCAIDDTGALWVGANIFELGEVYRVDNWRDLPNAKSRTVGHFGVGNPEVLAVRGNILYRMSDTNTAPSLMAKFRCTPPAQ